MGFPTRTRSLPRKYLGKMTKNAAVSPSSESYAFFEISNLDPRLQVAIGCELIANPGPPAPWAPLTTFSVSVWPGIDGAKDSTVYGQPLAGADAAEVYFRINSTLLVSANGIETKTSAERLICGFRFAGNLLDAPGTSCAGFEVWGFVNIGITDTIDPVECAEILGRVNIKVLKEINGIFGKVAP
jgi:hypothetical protein